MKNFILDTDLGGDCDDAAAIALINKFHTAGIINVLAVTYSNGNKYGALLTKVINKYYGNDFSVGMLINGKLDIRYGKEFVSKALDVLGVKKDFSGLLNANDLLFEKLTRANDRSVTVCCVGQLRNIANFLNSDFDGRRGADIFNEKVDSLVIMGGNFKQDSEYFEFCGEKYYGEYNFITDLGSVFTVLEKVKTEIVFSDFNVGFNVLTLKGLSERYDDKNPVSVCYKLFADGARQSWDPLAVLYAVFGDNDIFGSKTGTVTVSARGRSFFTPDRIGYHKIVLLKNTDSETGKYVESFFKEELL